MEGIAKNSFDSPSNALPRASSTSLSSLYEFFFPRLLFFIKKIPKNE